MMSKKINLHKNNFNNHATGNVMKGEFTIPADTNGNSQTLTTSAGIFDSAGILIRTLWCQKQYASGSHTYYWDNTDDLGNEVAKPETCTMKVLANNVKYNWEGVFANTSKSYTGYGVHKGNAPPTALCITSHTLYYGIGYNEQNTCTSKFSLSDIQTRILIDYTGQGATPNIIACCTDGTTVYWAGYDPNGSDHKMIYATKCSDDSLVNFNNNITYKLVYGNTYPCLYHTASPNGSITSIAVQKGGTYLFAAQPAAGKIFVFNKNTSGLVQTLSLTANQLVLDTSDGYLWLGSETSVRKYSINSDGTLATTSVSITGLQSVAAMAVSPDNNKLYICDRGTSQQIKIYNQRSGAISSTFGQAGGYYKSSLCADNKFCWSDNVIGNYNVALAFQSDGSYWITDNGNCSIKHYSSNHSLLEFIQYQPFHYNCNMDGNNPTRVFADALEFQIDYTKPLHPNNGSWKQKANWAGQITSSQNNPYRGFISPYTYPNGKTFCLLQYQKNQLQLCELKSDGTLNNTGNILPYNAYIGKAGSLYSQSIKTVGLPNYWYVQPFSGNYDANGVPRWDAIRQIDQSPIVTSSKDPGFEGDYTHYRPTVITSANVCIAFSHTKVSTGYHIGGAKNGSWVFKTALATYGGYSGAMPLADRFDIGNGVVNAGGNAIALDNTFFWSYTGEFWKASQTNIYNHIHESGLPINQFGVATGASPQIRQQCIAQDAGNAFSPQIVKLNDGSIYLYHNDEGIHSGIHRWKITGMNTITVQNVALTSNHQSVSSDPGDLLAGLPNQHGAALPARMGLWTFSGLPFLQQNKNATWIVTTGLYVYDRYKPDLSFLFSNPANASQTATCDLTKVTNGAIITNWKLDLILQFANSNPNQRNGTSTNKYLDLLDAKNKIIMRFTEDSYYPNGGSAVYEMRVNDSVLLSMPVANYNSIALSDSRLLVVFSGSSLAINLRDTKQVKMGVFEPGANLLTPASLRLTFVQNGGNQYRTAVSIKGANFFINQ